MIQIRELNLAEPTDFDLLLAHIEKLYAELFGASAVPSLEVVARLRQQIASRPPLHWAFLASDADREPVALATLAEAFAVFAHGHYGIISELWVRPDARGQGVGGDMIEHCVNFGRARGWQRIDVSAPPDSKWDPSFEFYRKRGFVLTGRKLKYLLEG